MMSTSASDPFSFAAKSIRATFGSTGSLANARPISVKRSRSSKAFNSFSNEIPSTIARLGGACTKGKARTSPNLKAFIRKIAAAKFVRMISESVKAGRRAKSSSLYKRMQIPLATRPQRPER